MSADIEPQHPHIAGGRPYQPQGHSDRRRFPRSVLTQKPEYVSALDLQRKRIHNHALAVDFRQLIRLEYKITHTYNRERSIHSGSFSGSTYTFQLPIPPTPCSNSTLRNPHFPFFAI